MEKNGGQIKGILAFITTDKDRYLGGDPLSLLAKDQEEVVEFSEAIAEAFLADILELKSGDYLIIKK
ncbi:capping complex subunit for YIEGIA [Halalkalibacter lacteus]|jgi:predicted house-cleaning noncanonical NTP pyrophosphatase (MazG superfamily)|uniref:capping complex subunit for YIEGIA n=1 Tax=Halalkalibacter lacteus TaxID=3090663 RepID=UPI002FCB148E